MSQSTVSNFVKLVVAKLKGDDAEVTAIKIQKKGAAAIKAQIAIKDAELLNLEEALETAKEAQADARINNGLLIGTDGSAYIKQLMTADNQVVEASEAIENLKGEIKFLQKEFELISK